MTFLKTSLALTVFTLLVLCAPAVQAQDAHAGHTAANAQAQAQAKDIYAPAMQVMHENMNIAPTGNADVDFMRGMIPHHQGAIDMAKIALEKGRDPEVRKLAEDIIKAQESEIAFMQDWLKKHE